MRDLGVFLSNNWRDIVSVVGFALSVIGFVATMAGLYLAWKQLQDTRSSVDRAVAEVEASRRRYNQYVGHQILRFLHETQAFVSSKSWQAAAGRLRDVSNLLIQVSDSTNTWQVMSQKSVEQASVFENLAEKPAKAFTTGLKDKWSTFSADLMVKVQELTTQFPRANSEFEQ